MPELHPKANERGATILVECNSFAVRPIGVNSQVNRRGMVIAPENVGFDVYFRGEEDTVMRAIIFLAVVVLIMVLVGWISFSSQPGRSTINVETQKIEQDTEKIVESGKNLIREAGDAVDGAVETDEERAVEPVETAPVQTLPPQ